MKLRKALTFQQIFEGRIHLLSAMRHIAQEHGVYVSGQLHFISSPAGDAFHIVHTCISDLERDFAQKKSRRRAA